MTNAYTRTCAACGRGIADDEWAWMRGRVSGGDVSIVEWCEDCDDDGFDGIEAVGGDGDDSIYLSRLPDESVVDRIGVGTDREGQ